MKQLKAYVLCYSANTNPIYSSWLSGIDHEIVEEYDVDWQPPADCGVVVSHLHYDFPTAALLRKLTEKSKVSVLVLADGILEFRNTFQNPGVASGSLFMPVHGHRIACIGDSQARHIELWGNPGKTEVVGLPRLDGLQDVPRVPAEEEIRVLVATARQPGFTEKQFDRARQALVDLRNWFQSHPVLRGKPLRPIWRLTCGLDEKIGVQQSSIEVEGNQILEILPSVHAVVTTPSTTLLESMLVGVPTAILDYTHSPRFVPAAWNINSGDQVTPVMQSLLDPDPSHLLFQQAVLNDSLQTRVPARSRMIELVKKMIQACPSTSESAAPLQLPARLLDPPIARGKIPGEPERTLKNIFPGQAGFRANQLEALTTHYDQLCRAFSQVHQRMDENREELQKARQQIRMAWRHHDNAFDQSKWLRSEVQRLRLALRISNRPTRLNRRLRVKASIAFQRWQFFSNTIRNLQKDPDPLNLERLFEWTSYPKSNRTPPTVPRSQPNRKKKPQIRVWKYQPTFPLLKRMTALTQTTQKRIRAIRVARAEGPK
ncbi:MAG: hypothetical protein VX768_08215 [Planctomycetota bacterium]|nr:hypothetical protein [Planctomycetota bacterium]